MNGNSWMEEAIQAAEEVYRSFLDEVVARYVVSDRESYPLGKSTQAKVDTGAYVDPRAVRLMTISGKGGYVEDPAKRERYQQNRNITLLDHLLSVVRGALLFAAMDLVRKNPSIDRAFLRKKLCVVAACAFLHDMDKDLGLSRNTELSLEAVEERMKRYGIDLFLMSAGIPLSPAQMRYFIEKVEASQAHRHVSDDLPPVQFEDIFRYVRLADQLDSKWVLDDPESGGLAGVVRCLKEDRSVFNGDFLCNWREVRLFDPHHPFLLDELQKSLSITCRRIAKVAPLIEVHQDGELFMLLPDESFGEIIDRGLDSLCKKLPFSLELNISNRGVPALYNGQPDHKELSEFIARDLKPKDIADLFKIKASLVDPEMMEKLDGMLASVGLQPRWPKRNAGALVSLYAGVEDVSDTAMEWLHRAAHLALLLNLKIEAGPKISMAISSNREAALLSILPEDRPKWIDCISDDASRRTITALWVTTLASLKRDVLTVVWGNDGILKKWLEGGEDSPGFNKFISGRGAEVIKGVKGRFSKLLSGKRVTAEDEGALGRCIFTGEPVPFGKTIDQATGLYEIKVSAFSGRENRPELLTSESAHTNVSPASIAEHRLRSEAHAIQGGQRDGVPALVSSPTTSGIFGGLGLQNDRNMGVMSLYDLNRLEVKKGNVLKGMEIYRGRYRMARLERFPEKLELQADRIRMLLKAARRVGRPFHVFRGLPTPQRSFFYCDAMPAPLEQILGGRELRLEQIPEAVNSLETAQVLLETHGLGYDVFRLYANPTTRFAAVCLSWCHLRDRERGQNERPSRVTEALRSKFIELGEEKKMSEQDGAFVRLGEAAAGLQQRPSATASTNEELLVFKVCMDAVNEARRSGQTDEKSLTLAVAGELETNLSRKDKTWFTYSDALQKRCLEVAELFVHDVWFGALKGKPPTQSSRRVLSSIYRMAFIQAHRQSYQEKKKGGSNATVQ